MTCNLTRGDKSPLCGLGLGLSLSFSVLKWSVFLERDMHLVFVYGTLKRGEPNDHFWKDPRLGVVKFIAKAKTVQKFPLTIASEYNLPYLLFKPGCGSRIDGEIFEVENLSPLDEFEGYPRYYSRMEEQVKMEDGELTKAWLYTLENFKPELLERNLLSHYSATNLKELPYKHGAGEDPAHVTQVKNFD